MGTMVTVRSQEQVPEGVYQGVRLVGYEAVTVQKNGKHKFVFHFQIEEGPYKGYMVDHWVPRIIDNAGNAVIKPAMALADVLAGVGVAVPSYGQSFDLDVVLNKQTTIVVKKKGEYTNIEAFLKYPPEVPAAPAPAPTAFAAHHPTPTQPVVAGKQVTF